jgi:hypothetical protein
MTFLLDIRLLNVVRLESFEEAALDEEDGQSPEHVVDLSKDFFLTFNSRVWSFRQLSTTE